MQRYYILFFLLTFKYCIFVFSVFLSIFSHSLAVRITQLSSCGSTISSINVTISSVIISLIFDLFILLKICKAKCFWPWLLPSEILQEAKVNWAKLFRWRKEREKKNKKATGLFWKVYFFIVLYSLTFVWKCQGRLQKVWKYEHRLLKLLKNPSTWNSKQA